MFIKIKRGSSILKPSSKSNQGGVKGYTVKIMNKGDSSMEGLLKEVVDIYRRGEEAVLVTLCSTTGSTPRKAGAKMLVYPDGKIIGTIGGGELEHKAIDKALEVMKKKESILWETKLIELEMVCGGTCTLYLEYLNGKCG